MALRVRSWRMRCSARAKVRAQCLQRFSVTFLGHMPERGEQLQQMQSVWLESSQVAVLEHSASLVDTPWEARQQGLSELPMKACPACEAQSEPSGQGFVRDC